MKTGTRAQREMPKTLHLSILNDSLEAVMSFSDSTLHSGFAGVVFWWGAQLHRCQSMCQEKTVPQWSVVQRRHKRTIRSVLMNQLSAHQGTASVKGITVMHQWESLLCGLELFLHGHISTQQIFWHEVINVFSFIWKQLRNFIPCHVMKLEELCSCLVRCFSAFARC